MKQIVIFVMKNCENSECKKIDRVYYLAYFHEPVYIHDCGLSGKPYHGFLIKFSKA